MDVANYFMNFFIWNKLDDLKPSIRPVLNQKLVTSKPATQKLEKLVIREWWRAALWFLRVKKLIMEKRQHLIPELCEEYE
jgi:hypothetical protein